MENCSPFMGDPTKIADRHTTTAFAGRHTLLIVTLKNVSLLLVVIPYPPFPTTTNSRYPVTSTILKL